VYFDSAINDDDVDDETETEIRYCYVALATCTGLNVEASLE